MDFFVKKMVNFMIGLLDEFVHSKTTSALMSKKKMIGSHLVIKRNNTAFCIKKKSNYSNNDVEKLNIT